MRGEGGTRREQRLHTRLSAQVLGAQLVPLISASYGGVLRAEDGDLRTRFVRLLVLVLSRVRSVGGSRYGVCGGFADVVVVGRYLMPPSLRLGHILWALLLKGFGVEVAGSPRLQPL